MRENDLSHGCEICYEQLEAGNYAGMQARQFDGIWPTAGMPVMPRVMEFEISNLCNLECVMCNGYFSSLIRARREKLPPLHNPYDREFVEQLKVFLPHLQRARFLGGEPFLNELYFGIWDDLVACNPTVSTSITTNGTVLNTRVRALIEKLKPGLVVSIDSLDEQRYEAIRLGARYSQMKRNLDEFTEYARRCGRSVTIAVCPMRQNWKELPTLVTFCNDRGLRIYFNTLTAPSECSLTAIPQPELVEVVAYLKASEEYLGADSSETGYENNIAAFRDMVRQLEEWCRPS